MSDPDPTYILNVSLVYNPATRKQVGFTASKNGNILSFGKVTLPIANEFS